MKFSLKIIPAFLIAFSILMLPAISQATLFQYTDRNAFTDAISGNTDHFLPRLGGGLNSVSTTDGAMTFIRRAPATDLRTFAGNAQNATFDNSTALFVSDRENFDITFAAPTVAFGMDIFDTIAGGQDNSTFDLTIFSGNTNLGTLNYVPIPGQMIFAGVLSTAAFDKIEVREVGIQPGLENEGFGDFITGTSFNIPVPGLALLFAAGLIPLAHRKNSN